ncbi:MAG: SpoIIE family protein phosphatase [Planctomycetota bacterium]|jgi:serine phosphatase RsbU (regulator of sigma subunit)
MAKLVLLQEGNAFPHEIGDVEVTIGRHPDCGIQLNSNTVSRFHAKITRDGDQYLLQELGSGKGTVLNGTQLPKEQPAPLSDQARIKFGPLLARFECEESASAAPAQAAARRPQMPAGGDGFGADDFGADNLGVDFSMDDGDDDEATIMGTLQTSGGASGFGMLGVQPEAKLKGVIEITRSLCGETDIDKMLPAILNTLFEVFPGADRGCILLKDLKTGQMVPRAFKHRREGEDATVRLSRTIVNKVLEDKAGILSADAASDDQFSGSESISNLAIRSVMIVPMLDKDGEPIGVINIDTLNPLTQFTNDDLDLLMTVASQASLTYENARLMKTYLEKQKQDGEMRIAKSVQQALLPDTLPNVDGWKFYASYDSAQAVGGDYYDAFQFDDGKIVLSFGDISGKGVPGAIIMSRMSSCVQSTMQFTHNDPLEAVTAINEHMCANAAEGRFVTYNFVLLDPTTNEMQLVNAGHMSPMIYKPDGSIDEFPEDSIGLPIGVMEGFPYDLEKRVIEPGEIVVLFTDGVDEAMNPEGELYTLERMRDFVANCPHDVEELGKALLADVRRHADGRPQNDDITIMVFGRDA